MTNGDNRTPFFMTICAASGSGGMEIKMNNFKLYKIRCLTNMHVGNGDVSYTLIDNQVQRDVITNFPNINSSSLKGSLREFLKNEVGEEIVKYIFGNQESGMGQYKIFPAMLLSIPVRSNKKPFFRATCPRIIKDFIDFVSQFSDGICYKEDLKNIEQFVEKNKNSISVLKGFNEDDRDKEYKDLKIEGFKVDFKDGLNKQSILNLENLFGEDVVIIDDATFSEIVSELPVIARNKLNNGESQNLWYEEVVPRETQFYFGVIYGEKHTEEFEKIMGKPIQIGGNATIGYGYCDISFIEGK